MADITLTVQDITRNNNGLTPAYTAMNAVDQFLAANNERMFIHVKNTNVANANLTVVTPNLVQGLSITDLTATIPLTSGDKMLGPFAAKDFNDTLGRIRVFVDLATGVTIGAFRI